MPDSRRLPADRGAEITITFDGRAVRCFEGETLATALLAAGEERFGTAADGAPRQPLCNMGTCFDCVVVADERPLVRACMTPVRDGMHVRATRGF